MFGDGGADCVLVFGDSGADCVLVVWDGDDCVL